MILAMTVPSDETTSHSTRLPKDRSRVAGYPQSSGETPSHLTNPAKDAGQVIGYPASGESEARGAQQGKRIATRYSL
jgi:hypothetical protein